jgi:YD repeat-containing protein
VTAANSQTFGYSAANRLNAASGPYGAYSWTYDLVGNRTVEALTPPGGSLATDSYTYPTTSNRIQTVTRNAATVRQMTYDGAGNILTDNRAGTTTTYTYNKRNRLASATSGALVWSYWYNSFAQLAIRTLTTGGTDVTHFIHDIFGNVIAETGGGGPTGATGTLREYIWLPEAGIAPTMGSAAEIARPLAVVEDVETASPLLWPAGVGPQNQIKCTSTICTAPFA